MPDLCIEFLTFFLTWKAIVLTFRLSKKKNLFSNLTLEFFNQFKSTWSTSSSKITGSYCTLHNAASSYSSTFAKDVGNQVPFSFLYELYTFHYSLFHFSRFLFASLLLFTQVLLFGCKISHSYWAKIQILVISLPWVLLLFSDLFAPSKNLEEYQFSWPNFSGHM
jgi:hypothetical protein